MSTGTIYMIPCPLGADSPLESLPNHTLEIIRKLDFFVVENAKTARHFVKACEHPKAIRELQFDILDKKTDPLLLPEIMQPCLDGHDLGIISEAGCPGIADPGSLLVHFAHLKNVKVVPLIGPSSILQALMASGFNGQSFAFHGYLPKHDDELRKKLKSFEKQITDCRQTQVFIETPYRTEQLIQKLSSWLGKNFKLCIAANINQPNESIVTKPIDQWRKKKLTYDKSPAVFLIYS